ncbi:peptide chain release factor 2 [Patescibacteria group bacterium]|nr:peptide chain release factor 2 [Patescibacteria group bacterium]MBU4466985.1 peptide chain release factor 2 [Patescibacteria group bacterium]
MSRNVFDLAKKQQEIKKLEELSAKPEFWANQDLAKKTLQQLSSLKEQQDSFFLLEKEMEEIAELEKAFGKDETMTLELEAKIIDFEKKIKKEELKIFLSGKYDSHNALLTITAGAGGQDSQDWATMLLRMYERYCQARTWRTMILEQSFGEGGGPEGRVGTKSVTLEIKGKNAYGLLRGETGIHRLVRISPFSSQSLRHTSFAGVEVIPEIENEKEMEIKPEDIKIEFYRASGPGGQNVNKRESSVRIIHLPSRIIVACQIERTQADNRRKAMAMLTSRLAVLEEEKKQEEMEKIRGKKQSASWGNQIRSYVLHPYKLAKDMRTQTETNNVEAVLNGDLDEFIESEIKLRK